MSRKLGRIITPVIGLGAALAISACAPAPGQGGGAPSSNGGSSQSDTGSSDGGSHSSAGHSNPGPGKSSGSSESGKPDMRKSDTGESHSGKSSSGKSGSDKSSSGKSSKKQEDTSISVGNMSKGDGDPTFDVKPTVWTPSKMGDPTMAASTQATNVKWSEWGPQEAKGTGDIVVTGGGADPETIPNCTITLSKVTADEHGEKNFNHYKIEYSDGTPPDERDLNITS